MDYARFVEAFLRRRDERRLRRREAELWKFAEALDRWLNELLEHPRTDWREQWEIFLAEQEAEGRIVLPESRQSIVDYLTAWAAAIGLESADAESRAGAGHARNAESQRSAGGHPETFGPQAALVEEEIRSRTPAQPLVPELPELPDKEGRGLLGDLLEPELAPLVHSAAEHRGRQIAAHGDSRLSMVLLTLNQAIHRYVFGIEDRHEELESPGERSVNDAADFFHGLAGLSGAAAGVLPGRRARRLGTATDPIQAIGHNADVAVELGRRAAGRDRISKAPQAFGSRAHLYFKRLNRRLNRKLEHEQSSVRVAAEEFRDRFGNVVRPNTSGSIGADVVVYDARDPASLRIFDLKTHGGSPRRISSARQAEFQVRFGSQASGINRSR